MDQENRVVVLIDMDCFYCQVEEKLNPDLRGKPIAVVQYNPWKGGGIIAVNYVARAMGVTRHMRGDEAKEKCPEIQLPTVPSQRGKADISRYREAGKDVAKVLQKYTPLMERASIDEAYLDITAAVQDRMLSLSLQTISSEMIPNSFALGYDSMGEFVSDVLGCGTELIDFDVEHARRLLVGAVIVSEIRAAVYDETGYRCSAGIAHNKILAKLVCGMNKPNKQTLLPKHSVDTLYKKLPVKKVKHLGGKFGDTVCQVLNIKNMAELHQFSERELQNKFDEKNGTWLYNIARGVDLEPVQARFNPKSIGCCKNFKGIAALVNLDSLKRWLKDLGDEIEDRLEKDSLENNRTPKQMVVSYSVQIGERDTSSSRSYNFNAEDDLCGELFANKSLELVLDGVENCKPKDGENNRRLKAPIKFLGISVGKFEDHSETKKTKKIKDYFVSEPSKEFLRIETKLGMSKSEKSTKTNSGKEFILQKFFQAGPSTSPKDTNELIPNKVNEIILESTLDKQESFFAKLLNDGNIVTPNNLHTGDNNDIIREIKSKDSEIFIEKEGNDSNETNYSASTINEEINKSIALFEDDPEDISRVSNMRQLLTSQILEKGNLELSNENLPIKVEPLKSETRQTDTFECTECGKNLPVNIFDMHADYHLALAIRDEERLLVRKQIKERCISKESTSELKKQNKVPEVCVKDQSASSLANFVKKLDNTVPNKTCSECGQRVPNDKFMEHLDFHEAQKLSRQINNKSLNDPSASVKRKRKSNSPTKKPKVPCKSIDLFFR